jgi:DHA3 family tetracycline resistance protein-like MFS transporter
MSRKLPAYTVYITIQGSFAIFFTMMSMISAIYRVQSAGLNPLQLVLVGTVLESAVFVFEIPTGIVADLYSRKTSVIIGYLLIGLGFMLEGSLPLFGTILLAQVIWGIGYTFTSGAEEAWLADELGEEGLTRVMLRGAQFSQFGSMIGIGLSVGLGSIALHLPIVVGGALILGMALFLLLFMDETGFKPAPEEKRNTWQQMGQTFSEGVQLIRGRPVLTLMMAIAVIYGLYSEGLDRLWEAHFLANFTFPAVGSLEPVVWFGIINIVSMFLVIGVTEVLNRRLRDDDPRSAVRVLIVVSLILVLSLIAFGLSVSFPMAVAAIWAVSITRRASRPLYSAWLNKGLKSEVRATVLSMSGQLDAVGQLVGGPIVGTIATRLTLRAALVVTGLLLSPVIWLYGLVLKRRSEA